MKKISFLLLGALIAMPALANDYDNDYDTYDEDTYTSYSSPKSDNRDTYAGFRIHRNEHLSFKYGLNGGDGPTVRSDNFGFGLHIGNRLTDNVKLEFETLYTGSSEKQAATDFDFNIWSNMLNVLIYENFGGAVEPYLGVGMGISGIWADISGAYNAHDNNFGLSFAVMGGVNFALNKYVDLNLGARYADYGRVSHPDATTRVSATEIYIGATYKFGIFQ